jgi:hypothetical protein
VLSQPIDAKSHSLALQCAGRIAIEAGRLRQRIGYLGRQKIFTLAITEPRYANRRVDRRSHDRRFAGLRALAHLRLPSVVEPNLIHRVFIGLAE